MNGRSQFPVKIKGLRWNWSPIYGLLPPLWEWFRKPLLLDKSDTWVTLWCQWINAMKPRPPWEANSRSALDQMNPAHILSSYSFKISFNIIFPSMPRSSKFSFLLVLWLKFCRHFTSFLCILYALPFQPSVIWLPNYKWRRL